MCCVVFGCLSGGGDGYEKVQEKEKEIRKVIAKDLVGL